ncbi:hypothetical protein Lsan_2866 [Legionella santicrucis]|uniref:Uncharacterized protein n=1 Tax=Legionella santicrucis TaxID=45074 RepID=A0A0W0YIL4_9GAMM|nr:hypothetical protein Lsan_2866 [Legionella santicrucis]
MIDFICLQVKPKQDFQGLYVPIVTLFVTIGTYLPSYTITKLTFATKVLLLFYAQKWFLYEQGNWHTNSHNYDHL